MRRLPPLEILVPHLEQGEAQKVYHWTRMRVKGLGPPVPRALGRCRWGGQALPRRGAVCWRQGRLACLGRLELWIFCRYVLVYF